jgi:hypothetical protein
MANRDGESSETWDVDVDVDVDGEGDSWYKGSWLAESDNWDLGLQHKCIRMDIA